MEEKMNQLTAEEMKEVKGGGGGLVDKPMPELPGRMVNEPHCRECGARVVMIANAYRCVTPPCKLVGQPMSKEDVDWY